MCERKKLAPVLLDAEGRLDETERHGRIIFTTDAVSAVEVDMDLLRIRRKPGPRAVALPRDGRWQEAIKMLGQIRVGETFGVNLLAPWPSWRTVPYQSTPILTIERVRREGALSRVMDFAAKQLRRRR